MKILLKSKESANSISKRLQYGKNMTNERKDMTNYRLLMKVMIVL